MMKVLVLHDRIAPDASPDRLDTLVQVEQVAAALRCLRHQVSIMALAEDLAETARQLQDHKADVVFNLVESLQGQGRWLHLAPALLERLGIPFTGSGSEALRLTNDKLKAKSVLRSAGWPTTDWVTLKDNITNVDHSRAYIVKSVHEHASLGLDEDSVLPGRDPERLFTEMAGRRRDLGGACFAEQFIDGREFNISLLAGRHGPEVLPPAEVIFEGYTREKVRVVGYRAKWLADTYEFNHTGRQFDFPKEDRDLLEQLRRLSRQCWSLFGLRGWARVDFRVDDRGRPWILEVNANPCLSRDAGFMAAAERAALASPEIIERILTDAIHGPNDLCRSSPVASQHHDGFC